MTARLFCMRLLCFTTLSFTTAAALAEREDDKGGAKSAVPTYFVAPYLSGSIDRWWTIGTASRAANGAWTVGDFIGYDTADVDGDQNPQTVWYFGSPNANIGSDSDEIISKDAFKGNSVLAFTGCIPISTVSYNWVAMFVTNQAFTGAPASAFANPPFKAYDIGVATRWEEPGVLQVMRVLPEAITSIQFVPISTTVSPALTSDGFCASYELRRQNGKVSVRINGVEVYSVDSISSLSDPRAVEVRTFERPATFSSLKWEGRKAKTHYDDDGDDE